MDRATRSYGLGRAPYHGFFHTLISIVILGLSAFLYHHFRRGGDDYEEALRNVYLYDVIISTLAIAGGLLFCLPIIGREIVLAIALAIPVLFMVGFGWTEFEHHRLAKYLPHHSAATALVVFLGFAAFLGFFAFVSELSMIRRRATSGPITA